MTLHRPPSNFFDAVLISDIATALEELDTEPLCRAIVLASEGKNFCAGAALGDNQPEASQPGRHLYDEALRLFAARKPTVAAVQGAAIGGGMGLALAADFRVGCPATRLSANFARLGFHHGFALSVTLPAAVGRQRAAELLLTGARVDGERGHQIGLLDRLVPCDSLHAEAHGLAAEIAASAPLATASIRATLRAGLVERVRRATDHEKAEQDRLITTRDFAEGVQAMTQRRNPVFEGR